MKKLIALLFLFALALAGPLAHAQNYGTPLVANAASPSPTANQLSVFEFTVPSYTVWEGAPPTGSTGPFQYPAIVGSSLSFVVATGASGATGDFGVYSVSGSTATIFRHTGSTSLANTGLAAQLNIFVGRNAKPDPNFHTGQSYLFAMCSSSTGALVLPYFSQPEDLIWDIWAAVEDGPMLAASIFVSGAPGYVAVSSLALPGAYTGVLFGSSWASDPNWGTDATDVCVNGSLPNTITLSNITPN